MLKLISLLIGASLLLFTQNAGTGPAVKKKSEAEEFANAFCGCLQESGALDQFEQQMNNKKAGEYTPPSEKQKEVDKKVSECFQPIIKDVHSKLAEMDEKTRNTFLKEYLKATIDTDCADQLMGLINWEKLLGKMEDFAINGRLGPMSTLSFDEEEKICACMSAGMNDDGDIEDPELRKKCRTLQKEWMRRYEEASDDEKEQLMEQIQKIANRCAGEDEEVEEGEE